MTAGINERLLEFRRDLSLLEPIRIVQKHITFGEAQVLSRQQHFELRTRIATHFAIHPHEVIIVGSAKLGFSVKPSRRYGYFADTSDIDVAIVSETLFCREWSSLRSFVDSGGYWENQKRFQSKFFDGWIRPDLLPGDSHTPARTWWTFFRELTSQLGTYKVNAGIYHDWHCLERYQTRAVAECREQELRNENHSDK